MRLDLDMGRVTLPRKVLAVLKIAFLAYLTVSTLAVAVGQTGSSISPETVAHRDDTKFLTAGHITTWRSERGPRSARATIIPDDRR